MSFKKRVCNGEAEAVAADGDARACGLFRGAGQAVRVLASDCEWKGKYEDRVIEIEREYVAARAKLRAETEVALARLNEWAFEKAG